jgi:predicted phage tail protein
MKRKVYLEGEIGHKFGKEFTMNVDSFGEAVRCLDANFSDFKKYLIDSDKKGVGFICEVAGAPLKDERELLLNYAEGDMIITAVPAGSGRGVGKVIAGIIIVVASLHFFGPAGTAYLMGTGGNLGAAAALVIGTSIGINLTMTGISEMLAPDPSVDNDQDESYLFQGTGQTILEGDPVPVLYGELRVPGRPISTQVRNERLNYFDFGDTLLVPVDPSNPSPGTPEQPPQGPSGPGPGDDQDEHNNINEN